MPLAPAACAWQITKGGVFGELNFVLRQPRSFSAVVVSPEPCTVRISLNFCILLSRSRDSLRAWCVKQVYCLSRKKYVQLLQQVSETVLLVYCSFMFVLLLLAAPSARARDHNGDDQVAGAQRRANGGQRRRVVITFAQWTFCKLP